MSRLRLIGLSGLTAAVLTSCLSSAPAFAQSDDIVLPGEVTGTIARSQCEAIQKTGSVAGAIGGSAVGAGAGAIIGKALFGKGGDAIGGLLGGLAGGAAGEQLAAETTYRCVVKVEYHLTKFHWVETVTRRPYVNGEAVRMVRNGEGQWLLSRLH